MAAPVVTPVCKQVGKWALEQPIGSGSFAIVWKAHHCLDVNLVAAVKEINTEKLNPKLQESLASEISVLKRTRHDNCVCLLDVMKEEGKIYLVMEFCGGGDLGHYLRRYGRVPEASARYLMQQLAEGLKMLRMNNLIHRDLKPQNLLLSDKSRQPILKIADFGFCRTLQPQGMAETLCGSPLYMGPEILKFHKYDAKADLWSVGTILFELLVGKPPYNGANHMQLLQNIERGEGARLPGAIAAVLSPACKELLQKLLQRDPVDRIGFDDFFMHAFITGVPKPGSQDPSTSSAEARLQAQQQQCQQQAQQQECANQQQQAQQQGCAGQQVQVQQQQQQQEDDVWASCVHGAFSGVQPRVGAGELATNSCDRHQAHAQQPQLQEPLPQQPQPQLHPQYPRAPPPHSQRQQPSLWAPFSPALPQLGAVAVAAGGGQAAPHHQQLGEGHSWDGLGARPHALGTRALPQGMVAQGTLVLDKRTGITARQHVVAGVQASTTEQNQQQQQQQNQAKQQQGEDQLQQQQQKYARTQQHPAATSATPAAPIPSSRLPATSTPSRPPAVASSPVQQLLLSREAGSAGSGCLKAEVNSSGYNESKFGTGSDQEEYTDVDLGYEGQTLHHQQHSSSASHQVLCQPAHSQQPRGTMQQGLAWQHQGGVQQHGMAQHRHGAAHQHSTTQQPQLSRHQHDPTQQGSSQQHQGTQQQQQCTHQHAPTQQGFLDPGSPEASPWDADGDGDDFVVVSSPGSPMSGTSAKGWADHKHRQQAGGWGALSKAGPAFLQPVASHARTALLGAAHHAGLLMSHHHNIPRALAPSTPAAASAPRSVSMQHPQSNYPAQTSTASHSLNTTAQRTSTLDKQAQLPVHTASTGWQDQRAMHTANESQSPQLSHPAPASKQLAAPHPSNAPLTIPPQSLHPAVLDQHDQAAATQATTPAPYTEAAAVAQGRSLHTPGAYGRQHSLQHRQRQQQHWHTQQQQQQHAGDRGQPGLQETQQHGNASNPDKDPSNAPTTCVARASRPSPAACAPSLQPTVDMEAITKLVQLPQLVNGGADLLQRVLLILRDAASERWLEALGSAEAAAEAAAAAKLVAMQQDAMAAAEEARSSGTDDAQAGQAKDGGAVGNPAPYDEKQPDKLESTAPASPSPTDHAAKASPRSAAKSKQLPAAADSTKAAAVAAASAAASAVLQPAAAEVLALYLFCCQLVEEALSSTAGFNPKDAMLLTARARSLVGSWLSPSMLSTLKRLPPRTPLPSGVDAVYAVALRNCSTAALDELMSLSSQAVQRYAKATDILLFLLLDLPDVRCAKPRLHAADAMRVHCCYVAAKMRQAACMTSLNASLAGKAS